MPDVYYEPQLRQLILKVRSKLSKITKVEPKHEVRSVEIDSPTLQFATVDGKELVWIDWKKKKVELIETIGYRTFEIDVGYDEPLTEDFSSAFLDEETQKVCEGYLYVLNMILAYAIKYEIDMSLSFNFFCKRFNSLVISSKARGKGSEAAIRQLQFVEEKRTGDKFAWVPEEPQEQKHKKKGLFSAFR